LKADQAEISFQNDGFGSANVLRAASGNVFPETAQTVQLFRTPSLRIGVIHLHSTAS
jgi:hypothetical protein